MKFDSRSYSIDGKGFFLWQQINCQPKCTAFIDVLLLKNAFYIIYNDRLTHFFNGTQTFVAFCLCETGETQLYNIYNVHYML